VIDTYRDDLRDLNKKVFGGWDGYRFTGARIYTKVSGQLYTPRHFILEDTIHGAH